MRVAFQPKGPRPLFQAVSADHFPPFLFEFDPHGHKLGPKIDLMPEIDPIRDIEKTPKKPVFWAWKLVIWACDRVV